ncbi:regulatory protein RecX [Allosaccharopolyspora coralli]|uniref:Regulatory protein RecX n=1 Tax=Allosaccharopolyspora coralli TaxID=2665642 RepID=A0A5Q3Q8C1_9PSEU|nr:regulatory protein RecX [Allosaccharopolyspora coralli]
MSSEAPRRGRSGRGRSTPAADTPDTAQDQPGSATTDSPESRARDVVYRLLAVRARSEAELRQALLRKDIEEDVVDATLRKFVDAGLVDDAEFAESWVHQRHQYQGLGRKALRFELRRKGVDDTVVTEALSGMDEDAESERARELVRRKLRTLSFVDDHVKRRRLLGMLARKGYGEGLSFRVVREEVEREQCGEDDL